MWHTYVVRFRLRSPLHVGYSKVGYLQRTRRYVPARTLRGGITARLAGALGFGDYHTVGRFVSRHLVCGYFYLARGRGAPLHPNYRESGLVYVSEAGDLLTESEFDRTFLTSATSTALNDNGRTAFAGSLHEVECLSPVTDAGEDVSLQGLLYIPDRVQSTAPFHFDLVDDDVWLLDGRRGISLFHTVLDGLQVGGERRYGFGRLHLCEGKRSLKPIDGFLGSGYWPAWQHFANNPFIAHAETASSFHALGVVEPLVGRFTVDATRFGNKLAPAKVCWAPGSLPLENGKFEVRGDGVFHHQP